MSVLIKDLEIPTEEQSVITINIYSDGVVTCFDDDVEREAIHTDNVPPVVFCRDCAHSDKWYADRYLCYIWNDDGNSVFGDGFCNYGIKKED